MDCPTSAKDGLTVKVADMGGGGLVTETVFGEVAFCCGILLSLTVRAVVYDPADEYVCVIVEPVPVDPSPKDQLNVKGDVPPLALAVNVTGCPAWVEEGL